MFDIALQNRDVRLDEIHEWQRTYPIDIILSIQPRPTISLHETRPTASAGLMGHRKKVGAMTGWTGKQNDILQRSETRVTGLSIRHI